jgi:dTDP-glucose 4,6-dehydratase
LKYIIIRPTNNYGIGQYPEKLIPISVKMLQRGKKIRLHDAGEPIRNWLHSDDTAAAVIKIIDSGATNEIYNIAGGFEQKNKETVKKIIKCFFEDDRNYQDYVDLEYKRMGQDVRYALNDDKLRQLGWEPKKNFDNEIQEIVDYYKSNFKW